MKHGAGLLFFFLCLFFVAGIAQAEYQKNKIAVLPFNLQGENFETDDMGKIVSEWLITAFVKDGRFDVIERKLLGQVLEEQQMVEAGIVTQESASEIGRLLGVKVIISGSVMKLRDIIEVNARIIDVASASIVTAENVRSRNVNNLQPLVIEMADKIIKNFPLEGYIANREQTRVVIDLGESAGVKPGMKFMAYKEGDVVRHPKTDEILYVKQIKTGIIKVISVQRKISEGVIIEETAQDSIEYGDFVKSMHTLSSPAYIQEDRAVAVVQSKKPVVQAQAIAPPPKRVTPASQKKAVAARPQSTSLSPDVQSYLDKIQSDDSKEVRVGAQMLYKTEPYDPVVLSVVNRVLLQGYNSHLDDKHHVDAMAWLCKLLGNSKDNRYMSTVQEVIDHTESPKIKKYAVKVIRSFPGYVKGSK